MSDLKAIAKDVFVHFPDVNKVYVTSDGQAFLEEAYARNHAVRNRTSKELKLDTFLREELEKEPEKTAGQWIEVIASATEVKDVQAILANEKTGKNRKSIIEAAEKRIAELTKSE
jgi:hypothetical protein